MITEQEIEELAYAYSEQFDGDYDSNCTEIAARNGFIEGYKSGSIINSSKLRSDISAEEVLKKHLEIAMNPTQWPEKYKLLGIYSPYVEAMEDYASIVRKEIVEDILEDFFEAGFDYQNSLLAETIENFGENMKLNFKDFLAEYKSEHPDIIVNERKNVSFRKIHAGKK